MAGSDSESVASQSGHSAANLRYLQELKENVAEMRARCFISSKADYACEELYWHLGTFLGVVGVSCSAILSYLSTGPSYARLKPAIGIASAVATGVLTAVQPGNVAADYHSSGVGYEEFESRARLLEMEIDMAICKESFDDVSSLKDAFTAMLKEKADLDLRSRVALNVVVQYTKWLHKPVRK